MAVQAASASNHNAAGRVPPRPYHFITVVWGIEYLDVFLKASLPTQLASGNLDAFKDVEGCRYRIFTRQQDMPYLDEHPRMAHVRALMEVDFVAIDDFFSDEVMQHSDWFIRVMSAGHRRSISDARSANAAMFFLPPDALFSVDSFANAGRVLTHGDGAVLVNAPRLDQDRASEAVESYRAADGTVAFTPRELVGLGIEHLHRSSESLFWDSQNFNLNPTGVYWRINGDGFLAHCFHLHPLLVAPAEWDVEFGDSIDGEYIGRACPEPGRVRVVQDSDVVAMFTLTQPDRLIGCATPNRATIGRIAYFYDRTARPEHRQLFSLPIRHHANGRSREWIAAEWRARALGALLSVGWICRGLAGWHQWAQRARHRHRRIRMKYRGFRPRQEPLWKAVITVWMDTASRRIDRIHRRVRKQRARTYKSLGRQLRQSRSIAVRTQDKYRKRMRRAMRQQRAAMATRLRPVSKIGPRYMRRLRQRYAGIAKRQRMVVHRARKLVSTRILRLRS
jgi:hypothetical protein